MLEDDSLLKGRFIGRWRTSKSISPKTECLLQWLEPLGS